MRYANSGSLTNYITENFKDLKWENKIETLYNMILGLNFIHKEGLIHCDFHSGNVLTDDICDHNKGADKSTKIVGIIPYITSEVLCEDLYTKAADIYSRCSI